MSTSRVRPDQPPRLRWLVFSITFAAVLVASSLALVNPTQASPPAPSHSLGTGASQALADPIAPLSAFRCTTGSSSGNVNTCIRITGSGSFVELIRVSAEVIDSARRIQVCLRGPNGSIGCSQLRVIEPGNATSWTWRPNRNVASGSYCARTWRRNNDGTDTLIGSACATVG